MTNRATITGYGFFAPKRVVTNDFFNNYYGRDVDTFLREKRNIVERRWMNESDTTSDLIVPAAQQAIQRANIAAKDLDLIIVATDTPDYLSPSTASVVQYKICASNAGVFDLNTACAGFSTALDVAWQFIANGQCQHILVVGAYGMSKFLNMDDHKIATLFADGAGAVVVSRAETDEPVGVLSSRRYADGQFHDYMGLYAGGTFLPLSQNVLDSKQHLLNFAKKIPLETNPTHWPRLVKETLNAIGSHPGEVAKYFFTQINIETIRESLDRLELPHDKSFNIMDKYGYTGSACIPMAMSLAAEQGAIKKNDLIVLMGSGGGVSMSCVALRWTL